VAGRQEKQALDTAFGIEKNVSRQRVDVPGRLQSFGRNLDGDFDGLRKQSADERINGFGNFVAKRFRLSFPAFDHGPMKQQVARKTPRSCSKRDYSRRALRQLRNIGSHVVA
jgi:hypothetical protein